MPPIVESEIIYCTTDVNHTKINCRGHLVSVLPDDNNFVVVVIDLCNDTDGGMLPCLCPVELLGEQALMALETSNEGECDNRKLGYKVLKESIAISSVQARRGQVQGNLLNSGPKNIKGRVVDNRMLSSLQSGCLREYNKQ